MLVLGTLAMLLASCGTSAPRYNYKELARASIRLNMDIDMKDNHQLYVESAAWLGVPTVAVVTANREWTVRTDFTFI